jgi:hypothetical protein
MQGVSLKPVQELQNIVNRHIKPLLKRAGLPVYADTIFGPRALPYC